MTQAERARFRVSAWPTSRECCEGQLEQWPVRCAAQGATGRLTPGSLSGLPSTENRLLLKKNRSRPLACLAGSPGFPPEALRPGLPPRTRPATLCSVRGFEKKRITRGFEPVYRAISFSFVSALPTHTRARAPKGYLSPSKMLCADPGGLHPRYRKRSLLRSPRLVPRRSPTDGARLLTASQGRRAVSNISIYTIIHTRVYAWVCARVHTERAG